MRTYANPEDCLDVAYEALKKSGFKVLDEDVQSLAESIAGQIQNWFRDCKHLEKK